MQLFADEGKEEKNKVIIEDYEIKVVKASSLSEGVHAARFYPLSADFYEGADYISIVQHVHWLSNQPIICRAVSRNYTVPEKENKPKIDTSCVICSDKFAWFKKAAKLGWKKNNKTNPPESVKCHEIGIDLMDKVSAASIVSFKDGSGNLTFPVILRYGKELLAQLELHASRILGASGRHICDPAKGYMFDITIGKNAGAFRTYKDSLPSVDTTPVDITGAPWKWDVICKAIKNEIMDIPSVDEVFEFYKKNYGSSSDKSEFNHPAFQEENNYNSPSAAVTQTEEFVPPKEETKVASFAPPEEAKTSVASPTLPKEENKVATFAPPMPKEETKVATFVPPEKTEVVNTPKYKPCNGILSNTTGYERGDAQCNTCSEAKQCYYATEKRDKVAPAMSNNGSSIIETGNIKKELDMLTQKIANN